MTAKPISGKSAGQLVLEDAFAGLSTLAQGFMSSEQVLYQRRMGERDFAFRREQFDTATSQWQDTFAQTASQFDERMEMSESQFAETLVHDTELSEARIAGQLEATRISAAVEYSEQRRDEEQNVAELRLRYGTEGQYLTDLKMVGENPSYQILTAMDGRDYGINEPNWIAILDAHAAGAQDATGPQFFTEMMSPEMARSFSQQLRDGEAVSTVIGRMNRTGDLLVNPLADNPETAEVLRQIAINVNDGGREDRWNRRSTEDQNALMGRVAGDVQTIPALERQRFNQDVELARLEARLQADPWDRRIGDVSSGEGMSMYASSGIHVRRTVDSNHLNVPALALETFDIRDRDRAEITFERMIDQAVFLGDAEEKWANQDVQGYQGEVTSEMQREAIRNRTKRALESEAGELNSMGMDGGQSGALVDYFQGRIRGEASAYPYLSPDNSNRGGLLSRTASNARRDSSLNPNELPRISRETRDRFPDPADSYHGRQVVERQSTILGEDFSESTIMRSPVGEEIIQASRFALESSDRATINMLLARWTTISHGTEESYPGEQRHIASVLDSAGIDPSQMLTDAPPLPVTE